MSTPRRVAVVGAGPCGLVACKTLREHGLDVTVYEAGDRVGGQWVLGNTSGTSAAYRSLRTNTHKGMSRFSDYELPADLPDFPSHAQMAAWFDAYARDFGLYDAIRLGARVTSARPRDGGPNRGWQLETTSGEGGAFDALVLANGSLWNPRQPEWPGRFDGERLHAKDYMDPTDPVDCRGRTVLVVGFGNTACELAVELASPAAAGRVLLSARSGQRVMPRRIGGRLMAPPHPADPLAPPFSWLPRRLRDALFRVTMPRLMARMAAGMRSPESVGLPPAPKSFFEKRVLVNDHVLDRIAEGAIEVRRGIRSLEGTKVVFEDGAVDEVDVLLCATGYTWTTPFLAPGVLGTEGNDIALYRGVMHPRHHDLFVVGVMNALCSIWPRAEQQARWVGALLSGAFGLPSQRRIELGAYPVLRVPYGNCQFHAADLARDHARRGA